MAVNENYISNIIRNHICPETERKSRHFNEKDDFYQRSLLAKPLRYILAVSAFEPRKNQSDLLAARNYLKNNGMDDLRLVLIGNHGRESRGVLESK